MPKFCCKNTALIKSKVISHIIIFIPGGRQVKLVGKLRVGTWHKGHCLFPNVGTRLQKRGYSLVKDILKSFIQLLIIDNVELEILCTSAVLIGSSNTGFIKIVNQLQRINLVINNPPHTAHISHSRLNEWRLVLSGIRVISLWTIFILSLIKYCVLWTCQVVYGKYSLYE